MKIIKRSGSEVTFDISKIMDAVSKANMEVVHSERLSEEQIETISNNVESICKEMNRSLSVEEIQDLVENQIMNFRAFSVARKYITYRYKRALVRKSNSTDKQILSLLECNNEEVKQENSNKNPTVNSVQRDYMAGEVSKPSRARNLRFRTRRRPYIPRHYADRKGSRSGRTTPGSLPGSFGRRMNIPRYERSRR